MHRKEATLFGKVKPKLDPPYLTKEEEWAFYSQFTLFEDEVDMKKLRSTMKAEHYDQFDPIVFEFVNELCDKPETSKIGFQQYLKLIDRKMTPIHQQSPLLFKLLVKDKTNINITELKEIVNEIGDKELNYQQIRELMKKILGEEIDSVSQEQFMTIMQRKMFMDR